MKLGKFKEDGWLESEYTGIIYGVAKLAEQNVFVIPDEIPADLAFHDGSAVIAKTQTERDAYDVDQAAIAETEYQNSKTQDRKKLDNYALGLIASINTNHPKLGISYTDSVDDVKIKAIDLEMSFANVPELLTLKEVVGDSRLPATPHVLEV